MNYGLKLIKHFGKITHNHALAADRKKSRPLKSVVSLEYKDFGRRKIMTNLTFNNCPECNRPTLKPKPSKENILLVYCSSCSVEFVDIKWNIDETKNNKSIMTGSKRGSGQKRSKLGYDES